MGSHTVLVYSVIQKEVYMKATGIMIYNMDMVLNSGTITK